MAPNDQAILDWTKYEGEILDLFVVQNKNLKEVMAHMKKRHNFRATERQYKYRFPSLKNVKAQEWLWVDQEMQRRAAAGKKSEPCLFGRPLPPERVVREIARHRNKVYTAIPSDQLSDPDPQRISVRTPPPMTAIDSGPNLDHQDYPGAQASVRDSSTELASFDALFAQERLIELEFPVEVEPRIDDHLTDIDFASEWNIDGDFNLALAIPLSPMIITKPTSGSSVTSTPGRHFAEQTLSPFSQLVNPENSNTHFNFQYMPNLPFFQLQSMLERKYMFLQASSALDGVSLMRASSSSHLPMESRQGALSNLLGLGSEVQLLESGPHFASKLQQLVPERYEGEMSDKIGQLLNPRSTGDSGLWFLFALAAYFASNNTLGENRTDAFLKWVIDQKYTDYLERLLQINTPTIHAFATHILKSAVRIKEIRFLTALLDHGIKFDSILEDIFSIGDIEFMKLVLSRVDPSSYTGRNGIKLLHHLVSKNHLEVAQILIENGVSVNSQMNNATLLYKAVSSEGVRTIRFLLNLGANVNTALHGQNPNTALGAAVIRKHTEIVTMLLEHDASTACKVEGMGLLEWSSLNCRVIYSLLKEKIGSGAADVTIGDLVFAAKQTSHSFCAYIHNHQGQVKKHQYERALEESIRRQHFTATIALLQHGVSPDCHTLRRRPLMAALDLKQHRQFCELLIEFKAEVNVPGILKRVVGTGDLQLLQAFVKAGLNLEEQGMEALVESALRNNITSTAFLLNSGVDVNTPGLRLNPLQTAAAEGNLSIIELLLSYGADINAPAYPWRGRTALQATLSMDATPEVVRLLLDKGADIFAPPAVLGGLTTLEAICHFWDFGREEAALCNQLLDLGAPVNRPNGEPSSALHGVIDKGWDKILARFLEPHRNAITNHMWFDEEMEEEDDYVWEPRTPTQLAAECGNLNMVRMLLDHGADINEAPGYQFGRTALQAAVYREHVELVRFLLEKGADVNARPAPKGGITALQGAAVSGNLMLVKFLLDKGADVNAAPSFCDGRYAIEGAAEHGRLDIVQLLLNAGAVGNAFWKTGFQYAIKLAEENGHFAIANLLKDVPQRTGMKCAC